jgi:hypothetical protein
MVFSLEVVMSSEFIVPSLWIQSEYPLNESELEQARVEQLLRLEEERSRNMEALEHEQRLRKAFVDRHWKRNEEHFGVGKAVVVKKTVPRRNRQDYPETKSASKGLASLKGIRPTR